MGEDITVNLIFIGASEKFERFKFKHQIIKANGVVSAEISVYGAWIDLAKRKLTMPPEDMIGIFNKLEKVIDFENIILNNK